MNKLTIWLLIFVASAMALPAAAQESVLYSFNPEADGDPQGRLLLEKGSLFGTTEGQGGSDGTVYELKPSGTSWKESTIVTFNGTNGAYPAAGLIADSSGNLYGTTGSAGTYNGGTVFMLSPSRRGWNLQTIWYFGNTTTHDGVAPQCDLLMDSTGTIYGTTAKGGTNNLGTVFKLALSNGVWTETVLYNFAGGSDGEVPYAGLTMDSSGSLYGTTYYGGGLGNCNTGCGTAFELKQSGGVWTETVLHAFGNGRDGQFPGYGPLVLASNGALYGTTWYGGKDASGTVYELKSSGGKWKETRIYDFTGGADGADGNGGLVADKSGTLYGTTILGGSHDGGTAYTLAKSGSGWAESVLYDFDGSSGDGFFPQAGVILDKKSGTLFGVTSQGGTGGWGTVYQILLAN